MFIQCNSKNFILDDSFIPESSLLHTLKITNNTVDTVMVDIDDVEQKHIILNDIQPYELQQYILYLQGKDFDFNEDIAAAFDYLGCTNDMEYPLDFWKIKLRDNWIRDNFYKRNLWKNPYYGLKRIPLINKIPFRFSSAYDSEEEDIIPDEKYLFVAGGAALFMAGVIPIYDDIDVFTIDKEKALQWVNNIDKYKNSRISRDAITIVAALHNKTAQLILRIYKSPAEIVYGFDLDCVGILWDGKYLWATERAIYAIQNMVNWVDPNRASPSYIHRLSKYMKRGFEIKLPLLDTNFIDFDAIESYWKKLVDTSKAIYNDDERRTGYQQRMLGNINYKYSRQLELPKSHLVSSMSYLQVLKNQKLVNNLEKVLEYNYMVKRSKDNTWYSSYYTDKNREMANSVLLDPVSILVLAYAYSFYNPPHKWVSDYSLEKITTDIIWKEQNPMEQLSGTFNPDPIKDIREWYSTSQFIKK